MLLISSKVMQPKLISLDSYSNYKFDLRFEIYLTLESEGTCYSVARKEYL